jgi:hypothetical protein
MSLYPNRIVQSTWQKLKPEWPLYLVALVVGILVTVGAFSLFEFWLEHSSILH